MADLRGGDARLDPRCAEESEEMVMTFASLFSGIGGFDLGFEQAGMTCIAQCEIDKNCQKLLTAKWPNVTQYSDVTALHG